LGWILASAVAGPAAWGQAAGGFETPVKTEMVTVWRNEPTTPNLAPAKVRVTVTCSSYAHVFVTVAQVEGDDGAEIYAAPVGKGGAPTCDDPFQANPSAIAAPGGGFVGVKNDLVVGYLGDTLDSGTDLWIFRPADHKVFFSDYGFVDGGATWLRIRSIAESKAGVSVSYGRVFVGDCSVAAQGAACVEQLVRQTGVDERFFSICAGNYRREAEWWAQDRCTNAGLVDQACYKRALSSAAIKGIIKGINEDPTAIAYDVQVFIPADAPSARTDTLLASIYRGDDERMAEARVTKVGGLIFCNPAE
jgi:hypothetical protein